MPRSSRRTRITALLSCLVAGAAMAVPQAASAGLLTGILGSSGPLSPILYVVDDLVDGLLTGRTALSAKGCPAVTVTKAFAPLGDNANYFLVPGATFANATSGWETQKATIAADRLTLPAGAVAVSPKVCVGKNEPTIRLVAGSSGSSPRLRIDALFLGTGGELRRDNVTTLSDRRAHEATPVIRLGTNTRAAMGQQTAIALMFTAQRGTWTVDDVYVDPFRSR